MKTTVILSILFLQKNVWCEILYAYCRKRRGGGEKNMEVMGSPSREMNSTKEQLGLYNCIITDAQKENYLQAFWKEQ